MALINTDVMAGQVDANLRNRVEGQRVTGDLRVCEAIYTTLGTEVTADVIQIAKLPAGAILYPEKMWIISEGIGGTAIVLTSIGDALDAARYATADIALTAASTVPIFLTVLVPLFLTRYVMLPTSNVITATTAGTFPPTAAKKIIFHLEYRMP